MPEILVEVEVKLFSWQGSEDHVIPLTSYIYISKMLRPLN